ncbi:MAG: hypothetical protein CM15mP119_1430 [Alphaproteobacteria bacterium]|nr:MAG: hypothetical protein CM15mP119_1430 [Alphaproteobacteria bacterium]
MTSPTAVNIFDGHNDLAYQLWQRGDRKGTAFLNENEAALSITAQKAAAGGLQAGLFALLFRSHAETWTLHLHRNRLTRLKPPARWQLY